VLIFSDFNYGCLPQQLVNGLIKIAKDNGVITAADSQSSSQIGDIGRYQNMDFLFPTEHEARISLRNHDDGIVVLSQKLAKISKAKNIILKLGSEGALLHLDDGTGVNKTDRLAPLNLSPIDVAGAGDSMLISTMMSIVAGGNVWQAACIGGVASALQISRIGNIPLQKNELLDCLK
jgi:sugar/nucleoside kinase (ribokinase family)